MSACPLGRRLALGAALVALPIDAAAQTLRETAPPTRRLAFGGDVAVVIGPRDADAFFNYTDYERNALRIFRARLAGEWRVGNRLSVLGELRVEDARHVDVAAAFVRWRPWAAHQFDVQAGLIPPIVGLFARHAYGRDNLVIGAPLAYQYLTSLRPDALPLTVDDLLRMRGRGWRPSFPLGSHEEAPGIALVSAFRWDTGVEARWRRAWLEISGALTRGAPAVPVVHETNDGRHWSGRAAVSLPAGLTVGVSAARGDWIDRDVLALVPAASTRSSVQTLVGVDAELGLGRWLLHGEWLHTTFDLPTIASASFGGRLDAWSAYAEARYRLHPRWQVAGRVERLAFSSVVGSRGLPTPWDAPVDRIEGVLGYRVRRPIEVRVGWQHDRRQGGRVRERGYPAAQVLYWF